MESISDTHKVSDSGYSNSCSNSQSQRSGSSNSRKSGSHSSRSSGYCGKLSTTNSSEAPPHAKRIEDGEQKKKKQKSTQNSNPNQIETTEILPTITTKTESEEISVELPQDGDAAVSNVVSCFVPVISPLLTTVIETDVRVLATVSAPHSPLTPNQSKSGIAVLADSGQKEENSLSKWEGENSTDKPRKELIETAEGLLDVSIPIETAKSFSCQPEDGFCCVISMHDGLVLYTTPSLTAVLGFPKDMWLGRSFIEFIHQKDRDTFATQIATELADPLSDTKIRKPLFVNLRKYRGLSSGFSVVENSVTYQPFQLSIRVRHVNDPSNPHYVDDNHGVYLVVVAIPVHSLYTVPNEKCKTNKFSTRHMANCTISHVDQAVVQNFGYFPQDMIGRSILDFYHPEDMPLIKDVYETVMVKCKTAGAVLRSQPYRFAVQNGGYALVETEWTSFVNPWTRKLEFIIGYNRILQGPRNPDVFAPKDTIFRQVSEKLLKESNSIKSDIHTILNQFIKLDSLKQQISQRCRDLATFMETILDDVSKCNWRLDISRDTIIPERDSVMLGEISPHHDYCDSKSSSETPPSYNQLNYNENIQRFFLSKPTTNLSDEMARPFLSTTDTDQEGRSSTLLQDCASNQKCLFPAHGSGSGSASGPSSESAPHLENGTTCGTHESADSYRPPHLTELLLLKHNEEMERTMMKRHKEGRGWESKHRSGGFEKNTGQQGDHGVKRSGSNSWDVDNHKISKHQHDTEMKAMPHSEDKNETSSKQLSNITAKNTATKEKVESVNLWPPFSVTATPIHTTPPCSSTVVGKMAGGGGGYAPAGMFPAMYYFPTHHATGQPSMSLIGNGDITTTAGQYQLQYVPSVMYPPVFSPSLVYPMLQPMTIPLQPPLSTTQAQQTEEDKTSTFAHTHTPTAPPIVTQTPPIAAFSKGLFQRPASQATSVKAEPGSAVGSITSASVANRPARVISTIQPTSNGDRSMEGDEESTSNSSFLKTDTGSGSNEDNTKPESIQGTVWKKPRIYPMRNPIPPWLDNVKVTSELIYRYQMNLREIGDILNTDLNCLKDINQPEMVDEQLNQLYLEMELEGLSSKLTLQENATSSSSNSSDENTKKYDNKPKKKRWSYSELVMIYEEDSPMPPPISNIH